MGTVASSTSASQAAEFGFNAMEKGEVQPDGDYSNQQPRC